MDAFFQVCFTGVNSVSGILAETTDNETFDPQSALFVRCDLTNEMEFQGLFSLPVCKLDAILNAVPGWEIRQALFTDNSYHLATDTHKTYREQATPQHTHKGSAVA